MRWISFGILVSIIGCRSDDGLQKFNAPPDANITSHLNGDSETEGYSVRFMGTGSDANHGTDELTATWYSGSDIICDATPLPTDGTAICEHTITVHDTEVTLVVKDPENASGEAKVSLQITPSDAPDAQISAPLASGVFYSDQKITFEGTVSDTEDDATLLTVAWHSDVDGVLEVADTPNSSGEVDGATYLTEGEHYIRLTVTDTTGKEGSDNVTVTVGPPNSAPLCEVTSPANGSAGPQGDVVTFAGTVSDVDVPASYLSVAWSSDKDGNIGTSTPDSNGVVSFPFAGLTVDTHVVSMVVTDEIGAECVANLTYTVGTAPSITIDSPIDNEVYAVGDPIAFSATVSDAQDQPDEVTLNWQLNGTSLSTQGATSSGIAQFSDDTLAFGSYNLVVTATDTAGLTDSDQINFTVNGLPSQPLVSINPTPASTDDELNVSLDTISIDPEGSTISYFYEWSKDGTIQSNYTASTVPSSATNKNQQWTVRVTPNDGIADGPSGEATIAIVNTEPTITAVTITPNSNVYNDITLTCSAVVTDPDESPTPTYEWLLGSTVVGSGTTLDLATVGSMPNDLVTCLVSVVDGDGATASASTATTVANRIPLVDGVSVEPTTVYTNDTLTATVYLSDEDGQPTTATFAWHVVDFATGTDTEVQNGTDNTLDGVNFFDRDDEVYVVITPNDGIDDGSPLTSSSITVANTAPTVAGVSLSPDPANAGQDDLLCTVDTGATDDDGDAITYTYVWTDESGTVQQTTTTTATSDMFPGSGTTQGTWTCEVTPGDGTNDGTAAIATVTVGSQCLVSGLVFSATFDAGSPVDESGFGHSISVENSFPTADRFLATDRAWNFLPDVNSRLVVSPANELIFSDEVSVSMYVRFNQPWSYHAESLAWKFQHPSTAGFHLSVDQNDAVYGPGMYQLSFLLSSAGANATKIVSYGEISDWFHVVGTFAQGVSSLYINGQLVATDTGTSTTITDSLNNLYIGGSSHPVSGAYNRDIDEFQVHNCALSEDEVFEMYAGDADGDGYGFWQDCDDNDPAVFTANAGSSEQCPAASCKSILDDGYSIGDGTYWINPDGTGAFEVYCDMTTDGGGWSLLLATEGNTTYWGWQSNAWFTDGGNSVFSVPPSTLSSLTGDHHSPSFGALNTASIRMCLADTSHCYTFDHLLDISLMDFYVQNITYYAYVYNGDNYPNTGSSGVLQDYVSALYPSYQAGSRCSWLGINEKEIGSAMLGLIEDENTACADFVSGTDPRFNDDGLGLGLWFDPNRIGVTGNSGNGWNGSTLGDLGPWFVFGR